MSSDRNVSIILKFCISIQILLKFVPNSPTDNNQALT